MSAQYKYVVPSQWESIWEPERVKFLKKLFADFRFTFSERDYDVSFMLAYRKESPYISMGCRPLRKQRSGHPFSFLNAFGFFYGHAEKQLTTSTGWTDTYADMCIREYEKFLKGEWPINKNTDIDVMERIVGIDALPLFSNSEVDPLS